jgi:hypothetical protein
MPERKGVPVCLTLDDDAIEILRVLSPSAKRLGSTLSELCRQEMVRREERGRWMQELRGRGPEPSDFFAVEESAKVKVEG